MKVDTTLTPKALSAGAAATAKNAAIKTRSLLQRWNAADGAPVFTVAGQYTARGWTNWTQGFLYGQALLSFELTHDDDLLRTGRKLIVKHMADHVTHTGVHDHGFNCISTYGNLRRLMLQGDIAHNEWELNFYEMALKASGAVQAARWTPLPDGAGFIHSFNGAHSLFVDTFRTLRICSMAHTLGHELHGEQDRRINLLDRMMTHARTSAAFNVYFGEGRDVYDTPQLAGRTVHEAIFNPASGAFRCPSSQQGYSPFTTWTRGLAWAMLGTTEEIEFLQSLSGEQKTEQVDATLALLMRTAKATCDFYIDHATALDGICYWDTGAPGMVQLGDWQQRAAEPVNAFEPVDSSASAIAAQGLLRLGRLLGSEGSRYMQAGLTVASALFAEPYLSLDPKHEGLLLHSIYHRPNGWDHVPVPGMVPHGEACMWGDYHLLELALLITRLAEDRYYTFF
jgi:unsaturated chondroitin disaccharide hydrolase